MQPAKAVSKAAGVSRARMFMRRDLAWVAGYPRDTATWVAVPENGPAFDVALTPDLLRRSTRTINRLLREFPRALPRLVGDPGRWADSHRALLAVLKPAVHGTGPLPAAPLDLHPFAAAAVTPG